MSQTHYMAAQQPFELQVRASQPRSAPDLDDPDVVSLWLHAVNVGLLGGGYVPAVQSRASSLSSGSTGEEWNWQLAIERVDWCAFTVLRNLLAARFDSFALLSAPGPSADVARLDLGSLGYPPLQQGLPFVLEREEPARASKGREVQIVFATPPPDELADEAIEALDLWGWVVAWGGYPREGDDPRSSGGFFDGAMLYDAYTVNQGFAEAFVCDEDAFHAVVNYACALHARHAVATVFIR